MPPQTPPLDRRDFYQDRRHDRGPGPGSSDASRWRDPYYPSSRDYPRRPPPQGYHRSYAEDSGPRGGTPSRSDRFWHEDQNYYRSYSGRYNHDRGRVSGGGRDVRGGPYTYRRSPHYDPYHADYRRSPQYDPYPYPYPYPTDYNPRHHPGIRSVAVPFSSSSRVIPDHRAEYYRRPCWDRKSDWNRDRDRDRDRERDRKPFSMKWSRSDSLPRDPIKEASESPRKRSREREVTVTPEGSPEEDLLSKKARLGWGQGLAKYEKLKVGSSDDSKQEVVIPEIVKDNTVDAAKDDTSHDKEADLETCIDHETSSGSARDGFAQQPISVVELDLSAREQQYETDAKPCTSAANTNRETVFLPKIDPLDGNSKNVLATFLTDLLLPDDAHTGDMMLTRHASFNELSHLKEIISKHLETTEAEIDSLETELKLVLPDPKSAEKEENATLVQTLGPVHPVSENKNIEIQADDTDASLISTILASNQNASRRATSFLENSIHLPDLPVLEELVRAITAQKEEKESQIKEKLRLKKGELKFKEQVLGRKYRLLRDIWEDELKVIACGKRNRTKTARSCLISDAGNLTPLATRVASDFAYKLMSDSHLKPYRPHLKIPAQILDEAERTRSVFVSQNGLIDNPVVIEKERALINPWTQKEKEKFMEMLCLFGKDFTKISSFLPHKTTADCVEFYYKSHKSESFAEVRKHLSARKVVTPGNYLGSRSSKKRRRDFNAASLDELGRPSVLAVHHPNHPKSKPTSAKKLKNSGPKNKSCSSNKKRSLDSPVVADRLIKNFCSDKKGVDLPVVGFKKVNVGYLDIAKSVDMPDGILWTHSLEGMSSCITASPGDKEKSFEDDDDDCSDDGWQDVGPAWADNEKSLFVQAMHLYGNDFERISTLVGSRTRDQCKTFFSKSWKVLNLEAGYPGNDCLRADVKRGEVISDDVCVAETESGTCSTQSCSKQEGDGFLAAQTKGEDLTQVQHKMETPEMTSSDKVRDVVVFGKLIKLSSCAADLCENEIKGSLEKVGLGVDQNNVGSLEENLSDERCSRLEGFLNSKSMEARMEHLPVSDPMQDLEKS